MSGGNGVVLRFSLAVLCRLADAAGDWAAHVGAVSATEPERIGSGASREGVDPDASSAFTETADGDEPGARGDG